MALSNQPSGQQWVRSYLKGLGYNDNQIGYNNASKSVTLDGNDFFKPTTTQNGQAYGTTEQLDNAYGGYQYKQNQKSTNDLLARYRASLNQPAAQASFSYDPNSDPQYQAALQQAQANAKTATGNAIASLNARGIDTSSVASDRAAQIQQQALGQVTSQVLPQLAQQAYSRWANEQNMAYQKQQDQLAGLLNLYGIQSQANQQYLDNQLNNKNANLNAALNVSNLTGRTVAPQSDWSGLFRQATNAETPLNLAGQQYQHGVDQDTIANQLARDNYNLNARQTNASIANMNADNARQQDSAAYNRFMDLWQILGKAPPNNYGYPEGTAYPSSGSSSGNGSSTPQISAKASIDTLSQLKDDLNDPDITKEEARALLAANASFLTDQDYRALSSEIESKRYTTGR